MRRLFVVFFLLMLAGCKSEAELKGNVFIVTKGAQNVKLGLVEVMAIPDERMQSFLNSQKARSDKSSLTVASLFRALPPSILKSRSDADGNFSIRLKKGRYAVAAHGTRLVNDFDEEYYWIVWVNADGQQSAPLLLSNDNMLTSAEPDVIRQTKAVSY